ncbi:MAG: hypothetical protein DRR16_12005 [Candidatus Parabeggiatoa sp. nov. 3]|nr:MAG: hypothetical protein DRR00_14150 [Gammaproteobacteria bacterium]RKZ56942.1 MAG: hypothetical protein DRQ99_27730 [Gammaproteobacteria bacterium]RKZ85441.1 MAG: hypothetical protein DRR16_12005 [Gammaproteobacteria bacterium]
MKVLIISRYFFSTRIAALSRITIEIALELEQRGIEVEILTDNETTETNKPIAEKFKVHSLQSSNFIQTYKSIIAFCNNHNYDNVIFLTSIVGLFTFNLATKFRYPDNFSLLIFTQKPRFKDFSHIKPKEFFTYFKRIFLRNYVFGFFIPSFALPSMLGNAKQVFFPSQNLWQEYNKFANNLCYLPLGTNNRYEIKQNQDDIINGIVSKIIYWKKQGKKILIHSGLATPFRGAQYITQLLNQLNRDDYKLYLFLYTDKDENIEQINQLKSLSNPNIELIDTPIIDIENIFKVCDVALYYYRYIGDIPECPLTLNELQNSGVIVCSNSNIGGINDMIPQDIPRLTGNTKTDVSILDDILTNVVRYKNILKRYNLEQANKWANTVNILLEKLKH